MIRKLLPLFIFLVAFSSCGLFDNAEPDLIIGVDEDIQIDLREQLGVEADVFYLQLQSTNPFDCAGLKYDHSVIEKGVKLRLNIKGILNPDDCEGIDLHATTDVSLNLNQGSYVFDIVIGSEITNQGVLEITSDEVIFDLVDPKGLELQHPVLKRIPDQTIWGYLNSSDIPMVKTWLTDRLDELGNMPNLAPGYYGHFEIVDGPEIRILPEDQDQLFTFVWKMSADESELADLISDFHQMFGATSDQLEIMTWSGHSYSNK